MLIIIKMDGMASVQPKKTGKATVDINYNQTVCDRKACKTLPPDKRKSLRQEMAEPILTSLH
jgi:hypothetical protein